MDFKVVKYKDIGKVKSGKRLPRGYTVSEKITKNKYIRVRDINDGYIDASLVQYITDDAAQKINNYRVNAGDVIISVVGTIGSIAQIDDALNGAYLTENCDNLLVDESICIKEYLKYYLLSGDGLKEITANTVGSTQPKLPIYGIENFNIKLPSIENQKKIVFLLETIDRKIKLNNQINDNLLELIDSLYNNIFYNIGNYDKAENIANITIGKTPPRSEKECFTTKENDMKWISISDLGKSGTYIFNTSERLTFDSVSRYNVKVIPKNTIILSFKLTVGRIAITTEDMTTNEAIAHFNLKNEDMRYFLYSYLKNFDYEKLGSTSSIATAVNSKIIKMMPIAIPDKEILKKYNKKVQVMFEKILKNEKENIILSQLRNILLPKLMNGKIDLENVGN